MTGTGTPHAALDPVRIATLLAGSRWRVEVSEADPSTNATAAARARAGAPEGSVAVTEHQTAGRGRLDRTWVTPARTALTLSVLLRPQAPARRWPWLPLLTGYAVREALAATGLAAELKWPNDVLVGGRKIAGILLERIETPQGAAAVIGIGLNTGLDAGQLPVPTATSVLIETGAGPDRSALLVALLESVGRHYDEWLVEEGPGGAFGPAYVRECTTVGRQVRVLLPRGEPLEGLATGIDADGRLLVRGPSGEVAVGAGDVVHVRPAAQG